MNNVMFVRQLESSFTNNSTSTNKIMIIARFPRLGAVDDKPLVSPSTFLITFFPLYHPSLVEMQAWEQSESAMF